MILLLIILETIKMQIQLFIVQCIAMLIAINIRILSVEPSLLIAFHGVESTKL